MAPRLSGQTCIFGVVFFVSKSRLAIDRQKKLPKYTICPESLGAMLEYWYIKRRLLYSLACEQAPSEVGKKFGKRSEWDALPARSEKIWRVKQVGRTPSSPDLSRLVPLALDYTRLSCPKPNWEPVGRLYSWASHFTLTVPLSTQVYKWVPANLMLGCNPVMD